MRRGRRRRQRERERERELIQGGVRANISHVLVLSSTLCAIILPINSLPCGVRACVCAGLTPELQHQVNMKR